MTAPRPGPPHPAPRGYRWVVEAAQDAEAADSVWDGHDRKCRQRNPNPTRHNPCNAIAVAKVYGADKPEYRCPNHLDGRWVDAGIVMVWALEPTDSNEEEQA